MKNVSPIKKTQMFYVLLSTCLFRHLISFCTLNKRTLLCFALLALSILLHLLLALSVFHEVYINYAIFATESDHYESDEDNFYDESDDTYKSVSDYESHHDEKSYDDHKYHYQPRKKKVYVPVFVPEKEKKKSKI